MSSAVARRPLRYAEWTRRLSSEDVAGSIFLAGPESLMRDAALRRIRERVLGSGDASRLGYDRFFGGESPLAEVTASLSSTGLFSAARLVSLTDTERCGRAPAGERQEFLDTLRRGTDPTVFVALSELVPAELERKTEFLRDLMSVSQVVTLEHPRPADALRWLMEESARRGLRLLAESGRSLMARIGPDLQELSRELDKLEAGLPPGVAVDSAMIRAMVGRGALGTGWELCRAAAEGRAVEALRQWGSIGATEPVLRIQWLLQKTAREAAAAGSARARDLALQGYELEFGVKSGAIPSRQDALALELLLASCGPPGSRSETPSGSAH